MYYVLLSCGHWVIQQAGNPSPPPATRGMMFGCWREGCAVGDDAWVQAIFKVWQ
jgi:hypothetical protein